MCTDFVDGSGGADSEPNTPSGYAGAAVSEVFYTFSSSVSGNHVGNSYVEIYDGCSGIEYCSANGFSETSTDFDGILFQSILATELNPFISTTFNINTQLRTIANINYCNGNSCYTDARSDINAEFTVSYTYVRIPRKLDACSTAKWTLVPRQSGQSERSDDGVDHQRVHR